jgi:hypothetical protein
MHIRVKDERLLADLLAFMRASGCIAYYERDAGLIEVIRPHAYWEAEDAEIRQLLQRWLADRPGTEAESVD